MTTREERERYAEKYPTGTLATVTTMGSHHLLPIAGTYEAVSVPPEEGKNNQCWMLQPSGARIAMVHVGMYIASVENVRPSFLPTCPCCVGVPNANV